MRNQSRKSGSLSGIAAAEAPRPSYLVAAGCNSKAAILGARVESVLSQGERILRRSRRAGNRPGC